MSASPQYDYRIGIDLGGTKIETVGLAADVDPLPLVGQLAGRQHVEHSGLPEFAHNSLQ